MACATLKRSLDWDSINQRPTKRRRCTPFGSPSTAQQNASGKLIAEKTPSPFMEVSLSKLTPGKYELKTM